MNTQKLLTALFVCSCLILNVAILGNEGFEMHYAKLKTKSAQSAAESLRGLHNCLAYTKILP